MLSIKDKVIVFNNSLLWPLKVLIVMFWVLQTSLTKKVFSGLVKLRVKSCEKISISSVNIGFSSFNFIKYSSSYCKQSDS